MPKNKPSDYKVHGDPSSGLKIKLPKPKPGGKPRRVGHDMNDPGGSQTPGAKKKRRKENELQRRLKRLAGK